MINVAGRVKTEWKCVLTLLEMHIGVDDGRSTGGLPKRARASVQTRNVAAGFVVNVFWH